MVKPACFGRLHCPKHADKEWFLPFSPQRAEGGGEKGGALQPASFRENRLPKFLRYHCSAYKVLIWGVEIVFSAIMMRIWRVA